MFHSVSARRLLRFLPLERAATIDTRPNDHETMMKGDADAMQFPSEALRAERTAIALQTAACLFQAPETCRAVSL